MRGLRIVAGRWGGRRLDVPRGAAVRPTSERVREAWMSILAPRLDGAVVLDLFAGSGALGLEALSRGARHATFVEEARRALTCLRRNIETLDAGGQTRVVRADALEYVAELGPSEFDIALADPPYGRGLAARLVESFGRVPFARLLSVERRLGEEVTLPAGAWERTYGETVIVFVDETHAQEEP